MRKTSLKKKTQKVVRSKSRNNKKSKISHGVKIVIIVFVLAIAILLYVGIVGINNGSVNNNEDNYSVYNGFLFEKEKSGLWKTTLRTPSGDVDTLFHYHPKDLENIPTDKAINIFLLSSQEKKGNVTVSLSTSLSHEGVAAIAGVEISKITTQFFAMNTKSAFISDINGSNFPVVHCGNASRDNFVVQIMIGGDNSIRLGGKFCAILYANTTNDTIRLADRFVYSALGIMKD